MPASSAPAADPHADDARPHGAAFASAAEQQAVDALRERLRARFPAGRAYALADLRDPGLPSPVARFIAQALQRRLVIEREALRTARSAWFDHDAPAVEGAWEDLFDVLDANARVPEAEWPRALDQATGQVALYLLRPAPTLAAFVFADGAPELPVGVILRRMAYFTSYPYLRDVVAAFVAQRGLERLDRDTFERLLARVERRTPTAYRGQWTTLLGDLFDTLGQPADAHAPGAPTLPARVLAPALADRGLDGLAARLAAYDGSLALADLARLIDDEPLPAAPRVLPPADSAPPPAPASPVYPAAPPHVDAAPASDLGAPSVPDASAPFAPDDAETDVVVDDFDERTDEAPSAPARLPVPPAPAAPVWSQATAASAPQPPPTATPAPPSSEPPMAARVPSGAAAADAPIWTQATAPAASARDLAARPADEGRAEPSLDAPSAPEPPSGDRAAIPSGAAWERSARRPEDAADVPGDDDERPLWQRFLRRERSSDVLPGESASLDRLETAALGTAPHAQRPAFIAALFSGDEGDYADALRRLADAGSWSDAAAVLLDTFRSQGVDLYDATAVAFTDAAEQRFLR